MLSCVTLCFLVLLVFWTLRSKSTRAAPTEEDYSMWQAFPLATTWILIGASLVFLNKYILLSEEEGGFGFPYPASLCAVQMFVNAMLTRTLSIAKPQMLAAVASGKLTWDAYGRTVIPTGLTMVFALVFSNAAYLYLSVSYIQMLKSAGPISVYITSCAVGIDVMRLQVIIVLGAIAFGVAATSMGERLFNLLGFLLQVGAFLCDAFKLVLMKLMVSSQACKLDPLSALYYYAPVCCFGLMVVATVAEPLDLVLPQARKIVVVLLVDALIAFALQVASVFLLQVANATTYSLCSVVRDVGLVFAAAFVFMTPLAGMQILGYANAICGILLFNALKEDQHCISRALGYCQADETKALSEA
jgi:hypothetical protein